MKRKRNIKRINFSLIIEKHKSKILVAYLVALVIFFSVQFILLQNWDMLVRILNANFLFHHGYFFEDQRAPLEEIIIGLLGFVLGSYAIFGYFAFVTLIFAYSLYIFSKTFKANFFVTLLLVFNPYFLFYSIKNGSELLLFAFLILAIALIKRKSSLAGVALGLAFLSKYDALMFLPLLLFLLGRKIEDLKNFFVSIAMFILTLTPYFAINFIIFHNAIFLFALSMHENNGSAIVSPFSSYLITYGKNALLELIPVIIIATYMLITKKNFAITKNASLLIAALLISVYLFIAASHLFYEGLGVYRFFLGIPLFLTLLAGLNANREDNWFAIIFAIASFIFAILLLAEMYPVALKGQQIIKEGINAFVNIYRTKNCTVQSNYWVMLDYYGLPSIHLQNITLPILNFFSPVNTTLPVLYNKTNIYIYGKSACNYIPPVDAPEGYYADINLSRTHPYIACKWLFNKINVTSLIDLCIFITT